MVSRGSMAASAAHVVQSHRDWGLSRVMNMIHIDDGNEDLFNFMTTLPEKETWVRCECARKRTADDTFVTRRLVITDQSLFFADESHDRVLDDVLLQEVEKLSIVESRTHQSSESHALGGRAPNDDGCDFILITKENGRNAGRAYQLKCDSKAKAVDLVEFLQTKIKEAQDRDSSGTRFLQHQEWVRQWYTSDICQCFIAFLIFLSFLGNVMELEIDPAQENPQSKTFFYNADLFFTIVFAVELLTNLFSHWFWRFWRDYWNVFDFFIVLSSVVALAVDRATAEGEQNNGTTNAVRSIRLLRAFRVMRLFGRLESIRKIISALGHSLIPVCNAFVIVLLIMAVYSIIGVNIFQQTQPDAFSTWSRGLYTMFSVTTMDGWQEIVVMPMLSNQTGSKTVPEDVAVVVFFVSFVVLVVWTMLPVVVAILLENFTAATHAEEINSERKKMQKSGLDKMHHTLDPIFDLLSHYSTDLDLSQKIDNLFTVMIGDEQVKTINFRDMASGLRRKKWFEQIHMSPEDFDSFTCNGIYGDAQGNLTRADFEAAMRTQLKRYVQRQVAKQQFLCQVSGQAHASAMLLSMKLLHMDILSGSKSSRDPEDPTALRSPNSLATSYKTPERGENGKFLGDYHDDPSIEKEPQSRSLHHYHMATDFEEIKKNGSEHFQERIERIMTSLSESVSDLQRELDTTSKRLETTTKQVGEIGRLQSTGSKSPGFEMREQNALSTGQKGNMHVLFGRPNGTVRLSSDIIFEMSPAPVKANLNGSAFPAKAATHKHEHSVFF